MAGTGAKIPSAFIRKLYRMLDIERPSIIGWGADGQSFSIRDEEQLDEQILPQYFRGRVDVFRQHLLEHGFQHVATAGYPKTVETFMHPCFVRGEPSKLGHIVCSPSTKRRRSKMAKRRADPAVLPLNPSNDQDNSFSASFIDEDDFDLDKLISSIKTSQTHEATSAQQPSSVSAVDGSLHNDLAKMLALHVTVPYSTSFRPSAIPQLSNSVRPPAPASTEFAAFSPELMDTMVEWLEASV